MKEFVYKSFRIVLILLIITTVIHAFYQSSLPPQESAEVSNKVGEVIEEVIPPDTKPGEYIQKNLRKLAHFSEFFFLGCCTSLYVVIYLRKRSGFIALLPFGLVTASVDEAIQIFSHRCPSVKDVLIDMLGYSSALLIVLAIFLFVLVLRRKYLGRSLNG